MGRASNFSSVFLSPLFHSTEIWCGTDGDETSHHQRRGQKVSVCSRVETQASDFLLVLPPICFPIINFFQCFSSHTYTESIIYATGTHINMKHAFLLYAGTIHINTHTQNLSLLLSLRTYKVRFNSVSSYSDTRKSSSDEPESKANFESTGPLANVRYCTSCIWRKYSTF